MGTITTSDTEVSVLKKKGKYHVNNWSGIWCSFSTKEDAYYYNTDSSRSRYWWPTN